VHQVDNQVLIVIDDALRTEVDEQALVAFLGQVDMFHPIQADSAFRSFRELPRLCS